MEFFKFIKSKKIFFLINFIIVLIGIIFVLCKPTNLNSIGASMIAAGLVAFLTLGYQYTYNNENTILHSMEQAGLQRVYNKRDLDRYDKLVGEFKSAIDVTGYSLRGFSESHLDTIIKATKENPRLQVRILVPNPHTTYSKERESLEDYPKDTFLNSINKIRDRIKNIDNIELRTKDFHLNTMIFRIDDIMFAGPYLHGKPSKSTITLELVSSGWLLNTFRDEFNELWESAKPYDDN